MPTVYGVGFLLLCGACHLLLATLTYLRTRHPRHVHCPTTGTRATITLDAVAGALLLTRPEDIKVVRCSLWPEHRHCFQDCRDGHSNRCRAPRP